MIVIFAIVAP